MEVLQKLLRDPVIQQCRLRRDGDDDFLSSALPDKPAMSLKPGESTNSVGIHDNKSYINHHVHFHASPENVCKSIYGQSLSHITLNLYNNSFTEPITQRPC